MHHFPVVLRTALYVTTLPVLRHETYYVFPLLTVDVVPRFGTTISRRRRVFSRHPLRVLHEVLLVSDDHKRNVAHVSALDYLFPQSSDVLKGVYVGEVENENVGSCASQTVEPVVCPFVVSVHREVRDDGYIRDFKFVQAFVNDDGGVVSVLPIRGNVPVVEFIPNELLEDKISNN